LKTWSKGPGSNIRFASKNKREDFANLCHREKRENQNVPRVTADREIATNS
jgi:hypothetical protein